MLLIFKKLYVLSKNLIFNFIFFFLILLNLPIAVLIIFILPIYRIKVGELEMRAIGHCSISMEIFLCELELNIHKKNSKYIWFINDTIFHFDTQISNKFLLMKWKEKISIGPRFIFEPLFYIFRFLRKFGIGNYFLIPYRHWLDHSNEKPWQIVDVHNVLKKISPQIRFTAKEEEIGKNYLEKYGLEKDKYICFFARTSEFRNDQFKSIRDSDIKTQLYGIEKLCNEKNLKAVRLGYSPNTKINFKSKNIIDYSNSQDRSDFLDFYLGFNCKFIVGSSSGGCYIPMMNRKKLLLINFGDIGSLNLVTNSMIPLILPKKIKDKATNEFVNYSTVFKMGLTMQEHISDASQFAVVDNNEVEICNAIFEMNFLIDNGFFLNFNDILQNKFQKIFENHYKFFPQSTKVSNYFLENNKNLLN
jgi:putative glycosyltransferase (TIGR04372 family)